MRIGRDDRSLHGRVACCASCCRLWGERVMLRGGQFFGTAGGVVDSRRLICG